MKPRNTIDMLLDGIEWKPTGMTDPGGGFLYATHTGVLRIGGCDLDVVVLNTGERVITEESMERIFSDCIVPTPPHRKKPRD